MEDHRLPFFLYWLIVLKEKTEKNKEAGYLTELERDGSSEGSITWF
jgi:hypothetical protein